MHLVEDNRKKKDGDDADFLADKGDEEVLDMKGENPLAQEELIEADDNGSE